MIWVGIDLGGLIVGDCTLWLSDFQIILLPYLKILSLQF